jgi:chromosome partitioning protein
MPNARVITLAGAKGGSLKTGASLNLAVLYAMIGLRIVLVDLDPQHSATLALPLQNADRTPVFNEDGTAAPLPAADDPLRDLPVEVWFPEIRGAGSLHIYRGGPALSLASMDEARALLERAAADADVVIVDTVPMVGALVAAAVEASDLTTIPTEPTSDALKALPQVYETVTKIQKHTGRGIVRVLLTKTVDRETVTVQARQQLPERYPGLLIGEVPNDVRGKESNGWLTPLVLYAPDCRAARAYRRLQERVSELLGLPTASEVAHA